MKQRFWGTRWRGLGLALALVAPCYGLSHANGVAVAEGCIGGGASGVAPPGAMIDRSSGLLVATDGFFLLQTYLDPSSIVSQTKVTVTTSDGADVPGAVKLYPGGFLGWEADAPLAVGTKLEVKVSQPPGAISFEDSAELTVVGEPTLLEGAVAALGEWYDFHHGLGEPTTCLKQGPCGSQQTLSLYSTDEQLHAVNVAWQGQPKVNGFVLWEASLELTPEQMRLNQPSAGVQLTAWPAPMSLGTLVFAAHSSEYCATLKVHDLRRDKYVSVKTCGEPQTGEPSSDFDDVGWCDSPPPGPLALKWCAKHPESTLPVCKPVTMPEHPADPDPTPNEPVTSDNSATPGKRTASACQLSPGPARGAGLGLVLAAVGAGAVVRRRRARS